MSPTENTSPPEPIDSRHVRNAQVLVACELLTPALDFFVGQLGFRVDAIFPADDPKVAMLSGHGLHLRLQPGADGGAKVLYLLCDDVAAVARGATSLTSPDGVLVKLIPADPPMTLPPTQQELVVSRNDAAAHWVVGRAGLRYRDLIPGRHGGAFIASHIRILEGGPVPDYVHFHKVRFQMIFCRKGWVKVVYEGQGEPFLMQAGDVVLQPPTIRHRVLESSAGAEVVEIGGPAEHITMADHNLTLPSTPLPPEHLFGGQRFAFHSAQTAPWGPWRAEGLVMQETGIETATDGLAGVRIVKAQGVAVSFTHRYDTEFCFYFVLRGRLGVSMDDTGEDLTLESDDSISIPGGKRCTLTASPDLEMLELTLPGSPEMLP
jgi:mannose-6-phosphate isomerase-like protein (cupin superfamily)